MDPSGVARAKVEQASRLAGLDTERNAPVLLLLPTVLFLLAVNIFPFVFQIYVSLTEFKLAKGALGFSGLSHYLTLLRDARFLNATEVVLRYAALAVTVELVLGFLVALALNQVSSRLRDLLTSLILLPMVVSPFVAGYMFQFMYSQQHGIFSYLLESIGIRLETPLLADSGTVIYALAAVDIWQWTPLAVLVFLAGLQSLSTELYDSAKVDGAGPWQLVRHLTIPLLKTEILIVLLLRLLDGLKVFDVIFSMTGGGPGVSSESLSLYLYRVNFKFLRMSDGAAGGILLLILAAILTKAFVNIVRAPVKENT